jgi:ElaB/YqjD/DUF883 family membrane-anchored ribosome-binding protein
MKAREWTTEAEGDQVSMDKLTADLRMLGTDVEQLLKSTAGRSGQRVAQVRGKAEESLNAARMRLVGLQDQALSKTRAAGQATDDYVRANPWQVMAISAFTGLVLGLLLAREGDSNS